MLFFLMASISLPRTNGTAEKAQDPDDLPLSGQMVWVQCKGYRCLAFRDAQGKWVNFYTGEKLTNFVRVVG